MFFPKPLRGWRDRDLLGKTLSYFAASPGSGSERLRRGLVVRLWEAGVLSPSSPSCSTSSSWAVSDGGRGRRYGFAGNHRTCGCRAAPPCGKPCGPAGLAHLAGTSPPFPGNKVQKSGQERLTFSVPSPDRAGHAARGAPGRSSCGVV